MKTTSGLLACVFAAGTAHAGDLAAAPGQTCRLPGQIGIVAFECAGVSLSVGAVYGQRETTDGVIATPPTGTPGTLLSGSDFDFDGDIGPDIHARWRAGNGWSLEGRYFSSEGEAAAEIPSITTFRTAGIGVTILGGGSIGAAYSSDFQSAEINVVKELTPGISLLAGVRHFGVDDNLRVNIASPATYTNWAVENDMWGGQLGVRFGLESQSLPLRFDATFKAGLYRNSVGNDFRSTIVGGDSEYASEQSFGGEINLVATYYVTDRFSIQAGYTGTWLDNVAVASATAQNTTQAPGGTSSQIGYDNIRYDTFSLRASYDF